MLTRSVPTDSRQLRSRRLPQITREDNLGTSGHHVLQGCEGGGSGVFPAEPGALGNVWGWARTDKGVKYSDAFSCDALLLVRAGFCLSLPLEVNASGTVSRVTNLSFNLDPWLGSRFLSRLAFPGAAPTSAFAVAAP